MSKNFTICTETQKTENSDMWQRGSGDWRNQVLTSNLNLQKLLYFEPNMGLTQKQIDGTEQQGRDKPHTYGLISDQRMQNIQWREESIQ